MIKEAIVKLVEGESLTTEEAASVMEEIMGGEATPAQIGAFMTALRIKGETVDEIVGMALTMRARSIKVPVSGPVVDTCGTGGDRLGTFNISTTAAFVAAGAGVRVAKHGNRAMSSQCGSADVLEALGVKISLSSDQVRRCIEEVGIGFMFAPAFHPAMKFASAPRREIGIRTVFNLLGPLTNPAGAEYQVVGVPSMVVGKKVALALHRLGARHALVVHGLNGMDEVSLTGRTVVWDVVREKEFLCEFPYYIHPKEMGLKSAPSRTLKGGSAAENAGLVRGVLAGKDGPPRDAVLMNAAAVLLAGDRVGSLPEGVELAREAIDRGRAREKLEKFVEFSQKLG